MAQVQLGQSGQGGDGVRESLQLIVMKVQNLEPEQVGDLKNTLNFTPILYSNQPNHMQIKRNECDDF